MASVYMEGKMKEMFIVELEKNVWIADVDGDPGRTVVIENAQKFNSDIDAEKSLKSARSYRNFDRAEILKINCR